MFRSSVPGEILLDSRSPNAFHLPRVFESGSRGSSDFTFLRIAHFSSTSIASAYPRYPSFSPRERAHEALDMKCRGLP